VTEASRPGQRRAERLIGPGIVVAATGVGAGDMVATLVAGERYGYTLLWAAIVGCLVKLSLAEATGRWHLATGRTIFEGWSSLGRWTHIYFGAYVLVWGFVYGATAMSATALPLAALFPVLSIRTWAIIAGLSGLVVVWFNRYATLEKVMAALAGVMFVTVVGLAIFLLPDIGAATRGLVPALPPGSTFYTLGLIGGVGGTITMAAYGYWINAKGWRDPTWMRFMRWDNRVAYTVTGVFVVSMLIVGAELLHEARGVVGQGDRGLLDLAGVLESRVGHSLATVFLIGFFAAAYSSILGVWHGVGLLFADFAGHVRSRPMSSLRERERCWEFRAYLLWLTFPPMLLLGAGRPFQLVLAYGVLGSFFMPFLALTLISLLNSTRTPEAWRNTWISNAALAIAGLLFLVVSGHELWRLLSPLLS
jgi:Mn2+/Fe2+ NRAMP family transporter